MTDMAKRLEDHLNRAEAGGRALTFAVIVPTCRREGKTATGEGSTSTPAARSHARRSFEIMVKSRFMAAHVALRSGEHGYVEGSQHLRPTRYKTSQYDTSVIVLRSDGASTIDGPLGEDFEGGLREAFRSRFETTTTTTTDGDDGR